MASDAEANDVTRGEGRRAVAAAAVVYCGLTALMGLRVLGALTEGIASDAGDPVLNAAILEWNVSTVPGWAAWWQFPSFYPVTDATAFTEHLLGVTVLAAPIRWLAGDPIATYNLTLLLTYPLSALAMYALAYRLTGRHAAAFLAGLAFSLAPYRMAHLPQIQVLALCWAPLALLGLHAWLDTGRRRWLALFGVCWLLQVAANSYMLVFFSLLVAGWVGWFLALRGRWRDTAMVGGTMAVAALPLVPILRGYLDIHAQHGLSRSFGEVAYFSADVAGLLCASPRLAVWGWLDVACRPEGELFAGAGLLVLLAGGMVARRPGAHAGIPPAPTPASDRPVLRAVRRLLYAGAAVYAGIVVAVLVLGPWQVAIGPLRASASSAAKPLSTAIALGLLAGLLLPRVWAALRPQGEPARFYAGAALVAWVLAWGPSPRILGYDLLYMAPYRWLMALPGVDGIRVPARFWMIVVLCLSVLLALVVADWLKGRSRRVVAATLIGGALLLVADGWGVIPVAPVPARIAGPASLRDAVVLELPLGDIPGDVAAQYRAVTGGWHTVNGYSGYEPAFYPALRAASRQTDDALFGFVRASRDLHLLVPGDADALRALAERQPGARLIARHPPFLHYHLPRQEVAAPAVRPSGERLSIAGVTGTCESRWLVYATDGNPDTAWHCAAQDDHEVTIDLGSVSPVGAIVHGLGPFSSHFPHRLAIDTSQDGDLWHAAWRGSVPAVVLAAAMHDGPALRPVFTFAPRRARYVRLRQIGQDDAPWSIRELEVWSGG